MNSNDNDDFFADQDLPYDNEISHLKKEISRLQSKSGGEVTSLNNEITRLNNEISQREKEIVRLQKELSCRNIPGGGNIFSAGSSGVTLRLAAIIAGLIVIVLLRGYTSVKSFFAKTSVTNIDVVAAFEACGNFYA